MARPIKKSYKRRIAFRESYDSVLIVCEGSKSEPNYLRSLCRSCDLSSTNIKIVPGPGSDPMSIVKFAEEENKKIKPPYDRTYCVFDRDGHTNYDEAVARIQNSEAGRNGKISAITSWPCFEVWVLLHYTYTTSPFNVSGGRSSCENVIKKIKENLPSYSKGIPDLHELLKDLTTTAITHAKRLEKYNNDNNSSNPATQLHELIEYLQKLKQ